MRAIAALLLPLAACGRGPFPGDATLDDSGQTPLMAAAMFGDDAAARRALALGCDVERTWQDRTPLHWAAMRGSAGTVDALLDGGARISARNRAGEDALQLAVESGDVATVRALLARGARLDAASDGGALLHRASPRGSAELVGLLVDSGFVVESRADARGRIDVGGWTALHVAAAGGNAESAHALLERGADVDARTQVGWTPLHAAAASDHVDLVDVLLGHGADPRATDALGRTCAHVAAELGHGDTLRWLRKRVEPATWSELLRATDRFGRTPLHLAAWIGGHDAVGVLLPDSDRDARTKTVRWTAAHLAALRGEPDLVGMLGGEVAAARDALGRTPPDLLPSGPDDEPRLGTLTTHAAPATTATAVVAGWYSADGYTSNPTQGQRFALWEDGVYVRRLGAGSAQYVVGVVSRERIAALLDELRETALLERDSFEYAVADGGVWDLRVRGSGSLREYSVWGGFLRRVQGDFAERLAGAETERGFELLERVRADVEAPIEQHLVDGRFRGLDPASRRKRVDDERR